MALHLEDLIKLAVLTAIMDGPVPLPKLLHASEMWHELNGRADLVLQTSAVMRTMLADELLQVTEHHDGVKTPLTGVDAQMAIQRTATGLAATPDSDMVEVGNTEAGAQTYLKLAREYYNG